MSMVDHLQCMVLNWCNFVIHFREIVLHNICAPARNAVDLSMNGSNKEKANT